MDDIKELIAYNNWACERKVLEITSNKSFKVYCKAKDMKRKKRIWK